MFRAAIALSNVSLLLVSGCGGSGSSNSLPASTTAAPLSGGQPCEHGMTSNGSCVFAQHVYNAFGGAWAAHGTPPKSLTVTMNPVDCSAQPHGTWLCRSRRSAVWVEFQLEQAPTKTAPVATPPPTTTSPQSPTAAPGSPPAAQVQQAVASILQTCISHSYNSTVDLGPVSQATDTLIRFSHTYSLDAQMGHSDLKAHTLRQALAAARATLRTCSPQDASRLDAVLSAP